MKRPKRKRAWKIRALSGSLSFLGRKKIAKRVEFDILGASKKFSFMKFLLSPTFSRSLRRHVLHPQRGFALIAAITLMLLLALISVGIMTLAATVARSSRTARVSEEARAQARLALEIAVGRLQSELGPDQRITAMSSILTNETDEMSQSGVASPYVLGVWNSWSTWLNRANSSGQKIQETYAKGRESMFRRWLISSADEDLLRRWDSVTGANGLGRAAKRDKGYVMMVGSGTLGANAMDKTVYAGLVEIDASPRTLVRTGLPDAKGNKNFIAWWITGENLKARVNLPKYQDGQGNSAIEILARSWNTPTPDSTVIDGLSSYGNSLPSPTSGEYDTRIASIFTRGTLGLAGGRTAKTGHPYFHDVSLDSVGLLTDVRFGGLKKDLSLFLSQPNLEQSEYYENNGADVGIRPYGEADADGQQINIARRPISSWKQLYFWNSLWKGKSEKNQDTTAPLFWTGKNYMTTVAADKKDGNNVVMNNRYTYLRQPILLRMYIFTGWMQAARTVNGRFYATGYQGGRPVYVWWNPYNTPLEMGERSNPLGGFSFSNRIQPVQIQFTGAGYPDILGAWSEVGYSFGNYGNYPASNRAIPDAGNPFIDKLGNNKLSFKPGEVRVFSHDLTRKKNEGDAYFSRGNDTTYKTTQSYNVGTSMTFVPGVGNQLMLMKSSYAGNGVPDIPVMKVYGANLLATTDELTPARLAQRTLGVRLSGNKSTLLAPGFSSLSLYELFMKPDNDNDSKFAFTLGTGLMDKNAGGLSMEDFDNGKTIEHYFPSFFVMNWLSERPVELTVGGNFKFTEQFFNLLWTGFQERNPENNILGTPNPINNPFWISYYGISAKSAYPPTDVNSRYPDPNSDAKNADLRVKSWVHSSPFFWGGQMVNPTDVLRKNHPYQFEFRRRRPDDYTQLNLEDIVAQVPEDPTGKAYFGPVAEDQVNRIVSCELPWHPPFSLAGLANFRLTPGWYDENTNTKVSGPQSLKRAKRIAYQSGVPGVGIGNSFADPMIPGDKIFYNYGEQEPDLADYWDHGFMVNDALWDSWFVSSMSDRPASFGGNAITANEVASSFVKNAFSSSPQSSNMLPNSRYRLNKGSSQESTIQQDFSGEKNWEKAAKHLVYDGAFNVNSTSRGAWVALLNGLKERKVLYHTTEDSTPRMNPDNGNGNILLTRFGIGIGDTSRYGQPLFRNFESGDISTWSDYRSLKAANSSSDGSEVTRLADEIIKQVKLRGPFLNMSEFINRRLIASDKDNLNLMGALQSAINKAGLNEKFDQINPIPEYQGYPNSKASQGSPQTGAPGYLVQSDILAPLGNSLTVRDDTFTVRAYGQVTDPSGKRIESRAWCEAIVQRTPDYVDPTNTPETPAVKVDPTSGELVDSGLTNINKAFGRRFKIISFRWLSPEEV